MIEISKVDAWTLQLSNNLGKALADHLYKYFSYIHEKTMRQDKKTLGYVQKTHLFNRRDRTLPINLLFDLCKLLKANDIKYTVANELKDINSLEWVNEKVEAFLEQDFIGDFEPYPHQMKAIKSFLQRKKSFGEIATSAGKSFIIYVIAGVIASEGGRILIITDTTALVKQLKNDILEYTKNVAYWDENINCIYTNSGDDKHDNTKIVISTYASMRENPEYFEQFNALIVDEAHKAIAPSVTDIIYKCWDCDYRIGMCGKLDNTAEHKWQTTILFGSVMKIINAKKLIDLGMATPLYIDVIKLQRKENPTFQEYRDYTEHLITDYPRMNYICSEAINMNENCIILFNRKKFGKALEGTLMQMVERLDADRTIEYIDGDIDVAERIRIKDAFHHNNNIILVASYKTIATGINAPNLRAILFAEPMKATITIIQAVGRILRKNKGKHKATVKDYWDTYGWGKYHSDIRKRIYTEEGHKWTDSVVNID